MEQKAVFIILPSKKMCGHWWKRTTFCSEEINNILMFQLSLTNKNHFCCCVFEWRASPPCISLPCINKKKRKSTAALLRRDPHKKWNLCFWFHIMRKYSKLFMKFMFLRKTGRLFQQITAIQDEVPFNTRSAISKITSPSPELWDYLPPPDWCGAEFLKGNFCVCCCFRFCFVLTRHHPGDKTGTFKRH